MVCDLCGSGFWVYGWRQSGGSGGWQRCEAVVATMVVWGLGFVWVWVLGWLCFARLILVILVWICCDFCWIFFFFLVILVWLCCDFLG